jgi:hypothetical protein
VIHLQSLTYINLTGDSIVFGGGPPYVLEHVKGLGKPAVKFATSRGVYQHGDTARSAMLEPRNIDFTFHIQGMSREDLYQKREALQRLLAYERVFDGERQGRLFYENDYGRWWIPAMPEGPDPERRVQNWLLQSKMTFRCSDPYWRDEAIHTLPLAMSDTSFRLPFRFPIRFGTRMFTGRAVNAGQASTPVRITIHGSGETPSLVNHTTGARITVSRPVAAGETLLINTDPQELSVAVCGLNGTETPAHGYLSLETPLVGFVLRRGPNIIEYLPNQPSNLSRVELQWSSLLEGV